jgi:hypothetical protein
LRTSDDERHLWRIVEAAGSKDRYRIVVRPVADGAQGLFGGTEEAEVEALYYSRLVPARYYLDVLGLYLLNLVVANSPVTTTDREKISVDDLRAGAGETSMMIGADPSQKEQLADIVGGIIKLFQGVGKNGLRDIFGFVAYVYLKLTWHECSGSYYGKAAAERPEDLEPSEFLLDVVNDAKTLRNKVEDFLSVPRNTFENEWPTARRLQNASQGSQRDFEALLAAPVDIKQMMIDLIR